ncbi:MAG TPA: Uma2 family endonuclease [Myxococcota bacterium]|nr:Uma2 family endonuclease [Myxococcota bacterium]
MSEALKLPTFEELYRQLRALPPNRNGEIVGGELITSPRPAIPHMSIGTSLSAELRIRFRRGRGGGAPPTGWWILGEPELHLSARGQTHVLSPDIAGWKRERMPMVPTVAYTELTPDWVCEILSPSTESFDRKAKARLYLEAGVTWLWLVSPRARTVEAYRREGAFWMQLGVWTDEDVAAIEPFQEFELELWQWWDGLPQEESKDT